MDYYQEKAIVGRLQDGVTNQLAAQFLKKEEEIILHLIATDMVKRNAFLATSKTRFGIQNLAEASPITGKGQALFNIQAT